jgi:hypothetical protein
MIVMHLFGLTCLLRVMRWTNKQHTPWDVDLFLFFLLTKLACSLETSIGYPSYWSSRLRCEMVLRWITIRCHFRSQMCSCMYLWTSQWLVGLLNWPVTDHSLYSWLRWVSKMIKKKFKSTVLCCAFHPNNPQLLATVMNAFSSGCPPLTNVAC